MTTQASGRDPPWHTTRVGLAAQFGTNNAQLSGVLNLEALDAPGTTASTTYAPYKASSDYTNAVAYPQSSYANPIGIIQIDEVMA